MKKSIFSIITKKNLLAGIITLVVLIAYLTNDTSKKNSESTATTTEPVASPFDWKTATYEDRQKYIENYLQHPNDAGYTTVNNIRQAIKKRFNYPKSVSFNLSTPPILSRAYVVEADSGWVYLSGSGTSENAFKQETSFYYAVKLKVTDEVIQILDVNVSE